ncbi:Serine/threonine protein kinase [Handroanthus impetiginosus]|uniref:non-specific serine/threonine protein kinase n=1 Tax=Handroanthus impetiginosus TaxID=429701 RepID=A0A2G9HZI9_9LAMI|nr:Serine/threonine protein kinase [Handroanthus impetiginosus]
MFLLFLNCILLFSIPTSSQPQPAINLLQFRETLSENSRLLLPWNQTTSLSSHCHWPRVSCYSNNDFQIRSLNLTAFGLSGVLENSISNLCSLPDLITLCLTSNKFTGNVPSILGNCSKLNAVFLDNNTFSGPIPPEIFKSSTLQILDLGFNLLSGTIPPEIGQCMSLEYLGLYNNPLSGEIPKELFSLPNLKFLDLSKSYLTGNLPDFPSQCSISDLRIQETSFNGSLPFSLSNCRNLRYLDAADSNLGGMIPQNAFQGLRQLEFLYLSENKFEGEIPKSLWGLRNLREVILARNRFNGSISRNITQWDKLTYLDLSENSLSGQIPISVNLEYLHLYDNKFSLIPQEIGNCTSLVHFGLQHNQISGVLPLEICDLQSLKFLYLFHNQINGPIPHCIGRLTSLEKLALYNNSITGRIPSEISNLTKLTLLTLAHNNLTGEVPSDLGKNIPGLAWLDLTGNHLTGEIPRGICSGNSLRFLTLGDNLFTGSFPEEIIRCTSLTRLILSNNLLQGEIPEIIENRSSISHFNVRRNLLEGKIPREIGFWSNLSMIDLSENKFSGSIPREFGRLQNLVKLRISANRLTGEIPGELGNCANITEIDLSRNKLSGGVPSEIVSSLTLEIIRLQENEFTGVIPDSFSRSHILRKLQLGNNMLEGSIPCSLSKAPLFSSLLNLSMNRLSGEIPKCIGGLRKLETLDISSNNFSGEIPPETNNMEALLFVNISFNHLTGQIPARWAKVLDSHPGLTIGNPRLCTLTNKTSNCVGHQKSHTRRSIIAVIITASLFLIASALALAYVLVIRIRRSPPSSPHQSLLHHRSISEDLPEDLNFEDILLGTEGWNDKYVIGRGKHGTVYRTESVRSRKHWAVKKVDLSETKFSAEMRILSSVRHRNVLRMRGYSIRDGYGFIVTEYMPEGTLYHLLHQRRSQVALDWEKRYRIALGIAQGLSYLHHDCVPQIIHRDIKSDNILLDSDLEPKIGDFGAAKSDSDGDETPIVSTIVGTLGYIAPENAYSTRLTDKCDVYSYGVILLELLCRKLPVDPSFGEGLDIVSWVRTLVKDYNDCFCCLDEEILQWEEQDQQEALWLMDLALQCTEMVPDIRPSMRDVVGSLLNFSFQRRFSVEKRVNSSL